MRPQKNPSLDHVLALLREKGPLGLAELVRALLHGDLRATGTDGPQSSGEAKRRRLFEKRLASWVDKGSLTVDTHGRYAVAPTLIAATAVPQKKRFNWKWKLALSVLVLLGVLASLAYREIRRSDLQSRYFTDLAQKLTFKVEPGPSPDAYYPKEGPHDLTLGYARLPAILERTTGRGFKIVEQARLSPTHLELVKKYGIYPIYREKPQAGLRLFDAHGQDLFSSRYPQMIYEDFTGIPPVVTGTLLFIENRELLDQRYPRKNPVVEWDRLGLAVKDLIISKLFPDHDVPGGSTLATQIEKYRHSSDGRTTSTRDKAVQMATATLRAYMDGRGTLDARRRIVRDYMNSVPLGAVPGGGEVRGLGHGLAAWHGAEFQRVNALLFAVDDPAELDAKARAYKEVLSLFLAQRRPAFYLQQNRDALKALVNRHLGALEKGGVITKTFRAAVETQDLTFKNNQLVFQPERQAFVERKAANAVRVYLMQLFGLDRLYALDRLDLEARSTIDFATQKAVTELLKQLKDKDFAASQGLLGERLLGRGDPADVIYSFTLRERAGDQSLLRVQADNVDGPFNVNEGGKLELGSTAKLRTFVTYLEIVEGLWKEYGSVPATELRAVDPHPQDAITRWALGWLSSSANVAKGLQGMLDAALDRTYSASPAEVFFTGGGQHRFGNFQKEDDLRTVTIRESLKKSINLPFVRLMRDVVFHYVGRIPGSRTMLASVEDPGRKEYLGRFANKEGKDFLGRFFLKRRGQKPEVLIASLLSHAKPTLRRMAAIFTVLEPAQDFAGFQAFLKLYAAQLPAPEDKARGAFEDLKTEGKYTLGDKGYVAGMHPLELWLVAYLVKKPAAPFSEVVEASTAERQEAYAWLFASRSKEKQDVRIRIMLEQAAFLEIHKRWQAVGYPFPSLVATYATALGSSGDKPAALADLVSLIQNDGVRLEPLRVLGMRFGAGTPYETALESVAPVPVRVLSTEVARTTRAALRSVVEEGTAIRVKGVFTAADGTPLEVGGKTGTGDNRYGIYAPGGKVIESRAMSRTATFVFYIGERFSGTLTAFVPAASAEEFKFTSALPAQILKVLGPKLLPLIQEGSLPPTSSP